jgi:hypothetical protein
MEGGIEALGGCLVEPFEEVPMPLSKVNRQRRVRLEHYVRFSPGRHLGAPCAAARVFGFPSVPHSRLDEGSIARDVLPRPDLTT